MDVSVLYVEDEGISREDVSEILKRMVREVHVAGNGAEGLEAWKMHRPDIVVTDLNMPVLNGIAMMRAIRAVDAEVKAIVTTAYDDTGFMLDAIEIGIDQYIIKPIDVEKLRSAIARCSSAVALERELQRRTVEREALIGRLEEALKQKDLLVREVYHRVKNNLAILHSLINLQSSASSSPETKADLLEIQGRMKSMLMIHERLYRSASISEVNVDGYITDLATDIVRTFQSARPIRITTECDSVVLPVDRTIKLGLLVNEVLTNSIKYAIVAGGGPLRIGVRLRRPQEKDSIRLDISDNGGGFPDGFDPEGAGTLGMTVILGLVAELGGIVKFSNRDGAVVAIQLPEAVE